MWELLFSLLVCCHCAKASSGFEFGDVLALLLGMGICTVGICACLGCYARRQRGLDSIWIWTMIGKAMLTLAYL